MEQAASRAGQTDVHMRDTQFDGAVGSLFGEVNVVYADDFSAAGVDDLLVEQVLAHGKPALIRAVVLELLFLDVQFEDAGGDECEMIVTRDEWKEFPAPEQNDAKTAVPALHGQAAWLGASVPVHDSALLLRSADLADRAASSLREGEALLLRGNGALTLGATPGIAVARMWLLSAACDVFLAAQAAGPIKPLSAAEIASWRAAGDELLPRLWQHLCHQC